MDLRGDVVHDDDSIGPLVKDARYAPIGFLACCVPYLQLYDVLVVYPQHIVSEFDSDSHVVVFMEHILGQPQQYR